MSSIWQLPVIWVVENNLYAMGTDIRTTCPSVDIAARADGYCIPNKVVDGNNALDVYEAAFEAVQRARDGGGPSLIECKTYRMRGHSRFDPAKYRPKEEVEFWLSKDAVEIIKKIALERGALKEKEADKIRDKLQKEVEKAAQFAIESEYPDPEESLDDVFAEVA
jgi:TPP-dependent pyruvate/acetoin dehydrogenase alpha subunit